MKKVIHEDNNHHSVEYKAERKANSAPVISESYTNDEGEVMLILANGNEMSDTAYKAMWEPVRSKILPKNYRDGIDPRTNWIK